MNARACLAAVCALSTLAVSSALSPAIAQSWPSKPLRLVMPFAVGGPVDLVARTFSPRLSERLGQPVIVENRVGAGGNIAGDFVLKSPPDGYTLLFVTTGLITNPFFIKGSPEPSQFAGVIQLVNTPFMLVASTNFAPKSFPEIVSYIRANPGKVSCASSGALPTVGCELLKFHAKADMIMVMYKGNAPAMQAVMAGEANLLFDPANTAIPQVKAGRVNAIATPAQKRGLPGMPDLPSITETIPDFYFEGVQGIAMNLATPRDIISRLNRELGAVMALPEVNEPLAKVGMLLATGTPEAFDAKMRSDFERFGRVTRAAGIKPE
jgi:tripartite-type tricarboxylate transporter receptor subunit TctC